MCNKYIALCFAEQCLLLFSKPRLITTLECKKDFSFKKNGRISKLAIVQIRTNEKTNEKSNLKDEQTLMMQ